MTLSGNWRTVKISEIAIDLLRIWLGVVMIKYSYPVILENGFTQFGDWLKSMSIPLPYVMAYLAKGGEFLGGLFLIAGLFTRTATLFIIINMIVAVLVANHGLIFSKAELPFNYLLIALVIFLNGPGKWSVDNYINSKQVLN